MKRLLFLLSSAIMLALGGCGSASEHKNHGPEKEKQHEGMNHSSSGEIPEGLKKAQNPTFKVGSKAVITASHMEDMAGAEAEISGAFVTTVYSISYTPKGGGKPVKNHKWIIHEEIKDAGNVPFKPGQEVTILADHMPGMKGAKGKVDTAEKTTVYMVDYTPVSGGERVMNHKWVTQDELKAK
ncbi:YdhK family protein [Peribacillus sp. SCS-37]|uniref:YdhK family protein n=1 Tax=Paraperibacillus esterisolvens TaxID=3115296 RepID=UPI0039061AAE